MKKKTSPHSRANRAAGRRRRHHGAAMVEGLVVIPFFVLIFAGIMFAGNVYEQKLVNLAEARNLAWTDSMANCGRAPNFLPPIGSLESVAGGNPGTQLCNENFGITNAGEASSSVNVDGAYSFSQSVDARVPRLFCNEAVQGADFQAAVGFLWRAMSPSVPASPIGAALDVFYSDPITYDYYPIDDLYMYY